METLSPESQTQQNKNSENLNSEKPNGSASSPRGKKYWKFVVGFFAVIIGVFILINTSFWLWEKYNMWQGQKRVQQTVEALKKFEEEDYQKAMADTYGGKTPQETLKMYIEAVEKGNYELASKYFIGDKQEGELRSFKNSIREDILNIISLLKQTLKSQGSFSTNKNGYIIRKPILVNFKLYPNGIWKIIEI